MDKKRCVNTNVYLYSYTIQYKFPIDIPYITVKFSYVQYCPSIPKDCRFLSIAVTIVFAEHSAIVRATITWTFQLDSRNCNMT